MVPGQKHIYDEFATKLKAWFEKSKPEYGSNIPDLRLEIDTQDDLILIRLFMILPEQINPTKKMSIPLGLREGFKDVE